MLVLFLLFISITYCALSKEYLGKYSNGGNINTLKQKIFYIVIGLYLFFLWKYVCLGLFNR
jgi:hypothetical protein